MTRKDLENQKLLRTCLRAKNGKSAMPAGSVLKPKHSMNERRLMRKIQRHQEYAKRFSGWEASK